MSLVLSDLRAPASSLAGQKNARAAGSCRFSFLVGSIVVVVPVLGESSKRSEARRPCGQGVKPPESNSGS